MEVIFESKGDFDNINKWLNKVSNASPNAILNQIAKEGEKSLAANTPKDTGETSSGWSHIITNNINGSEVSWINTAHPELNVNIATLIDKGHGTRNGGYVPPRPYIKKSMESIWSTAGDRIAKELIK